MTLAQLKLFFRSVIKVVAGGLPVGTPGANRAQGLLDALDKLAEFAAAATTSSTAFADLTGNPADNLALATALQQAATASQRLFLLTSTSTNAYADVFVSNATAQLGSVTAAFNASGLQAQVLTTVGVAYRPYRDTLAALNADLTAFWSRYGAGPSQRALCRFRSVAASPAIVSHAYLESTAPPASAPQFLHPHDSAFRLFGNQFVLNAYDWNHAEGVTPTGQGTVAANNTTAAKRATGSPAFENSGSGLRMMFTARHNQDSDYSLVGFTASLSLPSTQGAFECCFSIEQTALVAYRGSQRADNPDPNAPKMAYNGELLSIEIWDDGIRWYVGSALLAYDPVPPTATQLWLGVTFYYPAASAWLTVQAGGQVRCRRQPLLPARPLRPH